jgi:NhaP-type Na+/H+ or K+/H+ antiporter
MNAAWRLIAFLTAVLAGAGIAKLSGITHADSVPGYGLFVTGLLGFGLYASTCGIDLAAFRRQIHTVVLAVTLGVLAKAALIAGVMYLVFPAGPNYLIFAVAVAQIDPLSVAAMRAKSRMSKPAQTLLAAWSSFDDPITVLLTIYVTAFTLSARAGTTSAHGFGAGLAMLGWSLLWNVVLAAVVCGMAYLFRKIRARSGNGSVSRFAGLGLAALIATTVVAGIYFSLLLAFAVIGLFVRPAGRTYLDRTSQVAMFTATFAIGLLFVDGVNFSGGAVLGAAAFLAQVVVGAVLTVPKNWRGDRVRLALGQQNGLTAVILALLLEPDFPGAVATIGPAIVMVNLLHAVSNGLWDRLRPPTPDENVPDQPPEKKLVESAALAASDAGRNTPDLNQHRVQATNAARRAEPAG